MGRIAVFLPVVLLLLGGLSACHSRKREDKKLVSHYTFRDGGPDKRFIDPDNPLGRNTIYADVTDYVSGDSFILVLQKPSVKYLRYHLAFGLYFRYVSYAEYLRNPGVADTEDGRFMKGLIEGDSLNYALFRARGASEKNTAADKEIGLAIADSLIDRDLYWKRIAGQDSYWILRISNDSLLGPFSKEEYKQARGRFGVPENLRLDNGE